MFKLGLVAALKSCTLFGEATLWDAQVTYLRKEIRSRQMKHGVQDGKD